jgi:hypothetical protein
MAKMRLDAAVRDAIATLNDHATWMEEIAAGTRAPPDAAALLGTASSLRGVVKNLEDSWGN